MRICCAASLYTTWACSRTAGRDKGCEAKDAHAGLGGDYNVREHVGAERRGKEGGRVKSRLRCGKLSISLLRNFIQMICFVVGNLSLK